MSKDDIVVGVDACPAGWLATVITPDQASTETYEEFADLRDTYDHADRILVDIPIGLPAAERRRCDQHARDLLGSRRSSVFWPPCEAAANADDYDEANQAHKDTVGHGLSQQAFYIREKIIEVGAVVGDEYDGQVKESHPELCFAALNDQPIAYAKSSQQGRALRMHLLSEAFEDAEALYEATRENYLLKEVRRDDILDSIVLAVTARQDLLHSVPNDPASDEPRIYYPELSVPGITVD